MCGINGVIRFNEDISKDELESMNKSIKHRGPDDEGIFVYENNDYFI
jgi:asparagine synthase (glutamine-hydrolysing)